MNAASAPRAGLLDRVLERWGEPRPAANNLAELDRLHRAYLTHVPFENATKVVKAARANAAAAAIRGPVEFWEDHLRWGSGGTCFASTYAYQFFLRYLGFEGSFLFCHLPAEKPQAHSALLVQLEGQPVLVDVGYALPAPLPLPKTGVLRRATPYYDLETRCGPGGEYLVFSEDDRGQRFRYRFVLETIDEARYLSAWRETFRDDAPYMRRLALGKFADAVRYLYKDPHAIFTITREGETAVPIPDPPEAALSDRFGLPLPLLEAAFRALGHLEASRG